MVDNSIQILLAFALLVGLLLLWRSDSSGEVRDSRSSLETRSFSSSMSDIKYLIILVSPISTDIQKVVTYEAIDKLMEKRRGKETYIWLIADSEVSKESTSSYGAALEIKKKFQKSNKRLNVVEVQNINNPSEVFDKIIQASDDAKKNMLVEAEEVVFDCTGGTKLMTIGMTLACLSSGGTLVYFSKDETREGKYLEIDTKSLRTSMLKSIEDVK